jgi:hypothetical protein
MVLVPDEVKFKIYLIPPAAQALGFTQSLTEMSTGNIKIKKEFASEQHGIRHSEDKGTKRHEYLKITAIL